MTRATRRSLLPGMLLAAAVTSGCTDPPSAEPQGERPRELPPSTAEKAPLNAVVHRDCG